MRTSLSFFTTIRSIFSVTPIASVELNPCAQASGEIDACEEVRDAMLKLLYDSDVGKDHGYDKVWQAVVMAKSLDSLWYLRCRLYSILARRLGEVEAKRALSKITSMFLGHVSAGQFSVPKIARR